MTEAEWLACDDPSTLIAFLKYKAGDRKLRLFGVACCRRIWHLLYDGRSRRGVEAGEERADRERAVERMELVQTAAIKAAFHAGVDGAEDNDNTGYAVAHAAAYVAYYTFTPDLASRVASYAANARRPEYEIERAAQADLHRDIFGNPFRPVTFSPSWCSETVTTIARQMHASRDFSAMPILADALQDAGCDNTDVLNHCRGPGPHVRGCWVVDLVLGKV